MIRYTDELKVPQYIRFTYAFEITPSFEKLIFLSRIVATTFEERPTRACSEVVESVYFMHEQKYVYYEYTRLD